MIQVENRQVSTTFLSLEDQSWGFFAAAKAMRDLGISVDVKLQHETPFESTPKVLSFRIYGPDIVTIYNTMVLGSEANKLRRELRDKGINPEDEKARCLLEQRIVNLYQPTTAA